MKLRELELKDLLDVEKFHDGAFPLPDVESPLYFIQKAVENDKGEVIGAAFVFLTTEVTVILDKEQPILTKAKALASIFEELIQELPQRGVRDTHVFVVPPNNTFQRLLIEKFGFEEAKGTPLYRRGPDV